MEAVDVLIVGAGPAGLRAAQVLAAAGRQVLVLEKKGEAGNKTCGGGLSLHAVRELEALGLPGDVGRSFVARVGFAGEAPVPLDPPWAVVRTVARRVLGSHQLGWARAAGAEVRLESPVAEVDLAARTVCVAGRPLGYRHLVGADGSASAVRRALGLPSPRALFAAEYNIAGLTRDDLLVAADSTALATGYWWVFPHCDYTSVGAVIPKRWVRPDQLEPYIQRRLAALGMERGATPLEALAIEVDFRGLHFRGNVHLAGDAAGLASPLTAEGIYPALVSGEEVARQILEPGHPRPKTAAWLRARVLHGALVRVGRRGRPRRLLLGLLARAARHGLTRRMVSRMLTAW